MSLLLLNVKGYYKNQFVQLQFKISTKGYIASERDVLTEILSNVSTLEHPIEG